MKLYEFKISTLRKAICGVHVYNDFLKMDESNNDDKFDVDDFEYDDVLVK